MNYCIRFKRTFNILQNRIDSVLIMSQNFFRPTVKSSQNAETQMALAQIQVAYDAFVRSFASREQQTDLPQYFDSAVYDPRSAHFARLYTESEIHPNINGPFTRGPTMKYVNLPGMHGMMGMVGMPGFMSQQNFPPFNTFCDSFRPDNNSPTKILSLIFECIERIYPNTFEIKNILDNFDVLFATEFMKNILNELFCERSNLIKTHIPLLKYCNVSFLDESLVPLFVHVCHIGGIHYQRYVESFDLTSFVATQFNTITYLLHTLKNSNDVNVICYLLDHIKKTKTEQEIYTIFKQCPVNMHVLESSFFDICLGKESHSVEKPIESFHGFDINESNHMNIKNPTYDLRSEPPIGQQQNNICFNMSSQSTTQNPHEEIIRDSIDARGYGTKHPGDVLEKIMHTTPTCTNVFKTCEMHNLLKETLKTPTESCETPESSIEKLLTKLSELKFPFDYFVNITNILTDAYERSRFTLFEYLLKMNFSNINTRDDFGRTILTRIINDSKSFNEKYQYLDTLLDNKDIDTSVPNNLNQTPLLLFMKKYLVSDKMTQDSFVTSLSQSCTYINTNESQNKRDTIFQWHTDTNTLPKNIITPAQQVVIESMGDMGNFAAYPACFENQPFCDAKPVVEKVEQHDNIPRVSECQEHEIFVKLLSHPTCDPNVEDVNNEIPIFHAMEKKNVCTVKDILDSANFDVDYKYSDESTPIIKLIKLMMMQQSFEGCEIYFHVLDEFVALGSSLNTVDLYDKNALIYASEHDNSPVFRKLLSYDISTEILISLLKTLIDNNSDCVVNINLIKKKMAKNASKIHRRKWFYFF